MLHTITIEKLQKVETAVTTITVETGPEFTKIRQLDHDDNPADVETIILNYDDRQALIKMLQDA